MSRLGVVATALVLASRRAWFLEDEVAGVGELVRPGATCVDVGAEHGLRAYVFAHLAGPQGQVHGVEPLPGPRRFLTEVLRLLAARTVTLHAAALSSSAGAGDMSLPVRHGLPVHGRAFLTRGARGLGPNVELAGRRSVQVRVSTLDEVVAEQGIGRVDVVKADVEGAELAVLHGGRGVLERDHPVLLLEIEERHLSKYGASARDVVEHLSRLGYAPHVWQGSGWRRVEGVTDTHRNYAFMSAQP